MTGSSSSSAGAPPSKDPGPPPMPAPIDTPAQYADTVKAFLSSAPAKILGWFAAIFGVVWVIFGIAGFVMSLVCFGFSGSVAEKLIGVVLAAILGPWYWAYYYLSSSYCKREAPSIF